MRGMKDFVEKPKDEDASNQYQFKKEFEPKTNSVNCLISLNSNNNIQPNNILPNHIQSKNIIQDNLQLKNKNSKDLNEYFETHKMLMELKQLESEDINDDNNYPDEFYQNDNLDLLKEFKDIDEEMLETEDNFYNLNNENYSNVNYFNIIPYFKRFRKKIC